MRERAFQQYYPAELSQCFGCGTHNPHGHHLQSYWGDDGERTIARFTPQPYHTALEGYVYGGLLASLIDCHGTGSASAFAARHEGRPLGSEPALRFVTASLQVDYLAPTPLGPELVLHGSAAEVKERKVVVDVELSADGTLCARGRVVAVRMPPDMLRKG